MYPNALRNLTLFVAIFVTAGLTSVVAVAQHSAATTTAVPAVVSTTAAVPTMVRFSGTLSGVNGKSLSNTVGVTFFLYKDSQGGAPLWMETQNVQPDSHGNYSIMLGSTTNQGLPTDLFASGEARWLGVQPQGLGELPRVLLLSVPYAMKAADAETLGGLPPSAFMLAPTIIAATSAASAPTSAATTVAPPALGGTGTPNTLPLWTNSTTLGSSIVTQTGTGATAKIGINTTTPVSPLDVKGASTMRGAVTMPATAVATAAAGKSSQPIAFTASVFNSSTATATNENFRLQAEAVANNTTTATGSLNLLFGQGTAAPAETGLKFGNNGLITFAPGQTFPGAGSGTITGVTAGTGLTGGGTTGKVTLTLDTTKVPLLNAANTFVGDQTMNGNLTVSGIATGNVNASSTSFFGNTEDEISFIAQQGGGAGLQINSEGEGIQIFASSFGISSIAAGAYGVYGLTSSPTSAGIYGDADVSGSWGVLATNRSSAGQAIWAETHAANGANAAGPDAIHGISHGNSGAGVAGINDASGGIGVYGRQLIAGSFAGRFDGDVWVNGNLSKNGGSFKIDHPLDPSNKYLYHSFVESPDMKNIYDGVVALDTSGEATVSMPEWFGALNRDFRYQLTCIGGFAPVFVAEEITNNQFKISGGKPGMKVSWQVTGTRQDAWANAHRIPVEETKPKEERGTYLTPELFGAPETSAVGYGRYRFSGKDATPQLKRPSIPNAANHNQAAIRSLNQPSASNAAASH